MRALLRLVATLGAWSACARLLEPRICNNYSPLVVCRNSSSLGVAGLDYAPSSQAFGGVLEGHKPYPLSRKGFKHLDHFLTEVVRRDLSLTAVFEGQRASLWSFKICAIQTHDLFITYDGSTKHSLSNGVREFPVAVGVSFFVQGVSAWAPLPDSDEARAAQQQQQQASWQWANGSSETPWMPPFWLTHRLDMTVDTTHSFAIQRHTWRLLGLQPRHQFTTAFSEPSDASWVRLHRNESMMRTVLQLEELCSCFEHRASHGAGGHSGTSSELFESFGLAAPVLSECSASLTSSSAASPWRAILGAPHCQSTVAGTKQPHWFVAGSGCHSPSVQETTVGSDTTPLSLPQALRSEAGVLGQFLRPRLAKYLPASRPCESPRCGPPSPGLLRVCSFNAWNSNPPSWLWPDSRERWERYSQRMDLFASRLHDALPDIIAIQEVRLDVTLGPYLHHGQMSHIAERLPGYQYVSQPSNLYLDSQLKGAFPMRDEEGVAILSRFPIVHTDFVVLSRNISDREDEHSRLCLHVVVATDAGLVDVYTVHMPLSERARNRTTVEVAQFIDASQMSSVVLLLGDMNDEPSGASIRFWSNQSSVSVGGVPFRVSGEYRDAWLASHPEPEPRSTDETVRYEALTFPSDNPQKRIDFLFARGPVGVRGSWLIGQDPMSGTNLTDDHVGMVHQLSPVWASDHRGLVVDLALRDQSIHNA
jgi:endonuclease/exonuclease/phosphatase family metal-dependent hydrolase